MTRFQKYKIISPVFCYAFIWIFVALVLVFAWSESSGIEKISGLSMMLSLLFVSIYDVFPFFLDLLTSGEAVFIGEIVFREDAGSINLLKVEHLVGECEGKPTHFIYFPGRVMWNGVAVSRHAAKRKRPEKNTNIAPHTQTTEFVYLKRSRAIVELHSIGTWVPLSKDKPHGKAQRVLKIVAGVYLCYLIGVFGYGFYSGDAAFIRSLWVCYPLLVPVLAFFCMTGYFFLAGKWKHHLWRATNLLLSVFMAVGVIAAIIYLRV